MRLSIMTTLENALRCQKAGFDTLDIGLNYEARPGGPLTQPNWQEYAEEQARFLRAHQIHAASSHAYFSKTLYSPMASESFRQEYVIFERVLRAAGMMGIPQMTVHPLRMEEYTVDQMVDENIIFFRQIAEIAGEYGMRITIENMIHQPFGNPDNVLRLLDRLNDEEMFGMCIDTGHANLNGVDIPALIRRCGSRLKHTHVHDNRAGKDAHALPFWGNIDWQSVMQSLSDIHYQGDFNIEISVRQIPEEVRDSMLSYAEATGRHLLSMI